MRKLAPRWRVAGVVAVLDPDLHLLPPRVVVEVAADERAVLRPLVERIGRAVDAGEASSAADEVEERRPLARVHRQLAGGVEDHRVVPGEQVRREDRGVPRHVRLERAVLAADGREHLLGERQHRVGEAGGLRDVQHPRQVLRGRRRGGQNGDQRHRRRSGQQYRQDRQGRRRTRGAPRAGPGGPAGLQGKRQSAGVRGGSRICHRSHPRAALRRPARPCNSRDTVRSR